VIRDLSAACLRGGFYLACWAILWAKHETPRSGTKDIGIRPSAAHPAAALAYGTPFEVRAAVESVYENLYASGGVFAQCEFGPGGRPENVREVFAAWESISERLNK
jgi:hypothetical protein